MSEDIVKQNKTNHGLRYSITMFVSMLGFLVLPATNVFATSSWDGSIVPTSTLAVENNQGTHSETITDSYLSFMSGACGSTLYNSLRAAMTDSNGRWAIVVLSGVPFMNPDQKDVIIGWSTNSSDVTSFTSSPSYDVTVPVSNYVDLELDYDGTHLCSTGSGSIYVGSQDNLNSVYESTYPVTYPSGYAGTNIPNGSTIDSDGDGLSDYVESPSFPNRDNVFCDTSTTPHTCAYPDPSKKDLYVQIDWLDDGTTSYEPTSTQLGLVADKYAALGINFHADTGQYGGGNMISSSEQPTTIPDDFYHHKYGNGIFESANFDTDRYKIWHYMISGYNYDDGAGSTESTGKAEGGGDDMFISYGLLADNYSGSALDNAIAGTIVHELGHNMCLTDSAAEYSGQDSSCVFDGMDNYSASSNYHSAMNYTYQKTNDYSYSDGTNGSGDHDDISAINVGMDDFTWHDNDCDVGGPC